MLINTGFCFWFPEQLETHKTYRTIASQKNNINAIHANGFLLRVEKNAGHTKEGVNDA